MEPIIQILTERNNLTFEEIQMFQLSFQLLLMLPVVMTIVGIFRYIIGLKTISVYAPIILTFAFFEFGLVDRNPGAYSISVIQGLKFGLAVFAVVFFTTIILYSLLRYLRMHYVPKTTLVLSGVSLSLIVTMTLATFVFERKGLIYLDVLSILMIASLGENIIALLARKSVLVVTQIGLETLLISMISYLIIVSQPIQDLVFYNAWLLIIILVLLNLFLGKFWGLRLTEYWRFRELIFTNSQENDKSNNNKKK